jgi:hypothetical protein
VRLFTRFILIGLATFTFALTAQSALLATPTTAPATDEIGSLITRLGDADFHVRRDASNRLREIGVAALPELKRAAEDQNPEIRSRAAQIVHALEYRHVPGRPLHQNRTRTRSVNMRIVNGQRAIDVNDEGRRIKIIQSGDGIEMTVVGELAGRPATELYKAATPDQLKSENPEAYALYERWSRGIGSDFDGMGMPGNIILQGQGNLVLVPPMQPMPLLRAGGDDLGALRDRVEQQMQNAKLPPDQKQRVHDAIDNVLQSMNIGAPAAGDAADERIGRYDKACDELRKTLSDLHLPDPGDALPPPKGARLGISVQPDFATGGVGISHVVPNSRADRIGLQSDDVIRRINGKEVGDVKELRRLVTEHARGLTLDIMRDGREMKLEEK